MFNGPEYQPKEDFKRLLSQAIRIKSLMMDGEWRTLPEIAEATGDPQASISAQLRHLRKERFGGYRVLRRPRSSRRRGLFEYQVLPPEDES